MTMLPAEIWLIIIDIVIEEAIISLEHCDYITHPYIHDIISSIDRRRQQRCDSYYRLRLVCRMFNALLGDQPSQWLEDYTSLPLPHTTRALYLSFKTLYAAQVRVSLLEPATCRRLVHIDVPCTVDPVPNLAHLSEFLAAIAGQAFPNVRRLSLHVDGRPSHDHEVTSFWSRLHCGFPRLVTLVIKTDMHARLILSEMAEEVITFETMDTLYLKGTVSYSGCRFPRLRHASIVATNNVTSKELMELSPHLESLVDDTNYILPMDARSFFNLKSLCIPAWRVEHIVPLSRRHPLEQLWLLPYPFGGDYGKYVSFDLILKKIPGVSRIMVALPLAARRGRKPCMDVFKRMKLDAPGLSMVPSPYDSHILVIKQSNPEKDGMLKRVWSRIHW
jgi:hypothetical protein